MEIKRDCYLHTLISKQPSAQSKIRKSAIRQSRSILIISVIPSLVLCQDLVQIKMRSSAC